MWAAMPLPWNADGSLDAGALGDGERLPGGGPARRVLHGHRRRVPHPRAGRIPAVIDVFAVGRPPGRAADRGGHGLGHPAGRVERTRATPATADRDRAGRAAVLGRPERLERSTSTGRCRPPYRTSASSSTTPSASGGSWTRPDQGIADEVPAIVGTKYDGWDPDEFAEICAADARTRAPAGRRRDRALVRLSVESRCAHGWPT